MRKIIEFILMFVIVFHVYLFAFSMGIQQCKNEKNITNSVNDVQLEFDNH